MTYSFIDENSFPSTVPLVMTHGKVACADFRRKCFIQAAPDSWGCLCGFVRKTLNRLFASVLVNLGKSGELADKAGVHVR